MEIGVLQAFSFLAFVAAAIVIGYGVLGRFARVTYRDISFIAAVVLVLSMAYAKAAENLQRSEYWSGPREFGAVAETSLFVIGCMWATTMLILLSSARIRQYLQRV